MTKGILQKRCVIKSGKSPKGGDNHEVLNSKFGLFERRNEYHGLFPFSFRIFYRRIVAPPPAIHY